MTANNQIGQFVRDLYDVALPLGLGLERCSKWTVDQQARDMTCPQLVCQFVVSESKQFEQ
ncbi:MAG: hypothetical protein ACK56N_11205 [Betaproteobacteria bacterium]|jgi:hypothetical protein